MEFRGGGQGLAADSEVKVGKVRAGGGVAGQGRKVRLDAANDCIWHGTQAEETAAGAGMRMGVWVWWGERRKGERRKRRCNAVGRERTGERRR